MKNFIQKFKYFILGGIAFASLGVYAASLQPSYTPSLIPVETSKYYLGSTSPSRTWLGIYVDNICLTSDTCRSTWPTGGSGTFPFTVQTGYNSTSTAIGFLNGLFSTASSTFSGNLFLTSAFANGLLYTGTNGLVQTTATTSVTCSGSASCTSFTVLGSSPITITAASGGLSAYDAWTHPVAGQSATTSLMLFNRNASTTGLSTGYGYFGTTATTTIDTLGNIVIPSGSSLTNTGVSNGCGTWASGVLGSTGVACGAGSGGAFPFTVESWGNSTTSILGFHGGFISNASSTIASSLFLSSLSQGSLYLGTNGLVKSTATSTPSVTAPITYSGTLGYFLGGASGAFDCTSASSGVKGCITAADYSILKTATSTFTWPLIYTNSTNVVTWGGLSTSSAISSGAAVLYATGVNTMASAATGTISASGGITVTAGQSIIGSGLTVGCTVATASVPGCLAAADFATFNGKLGSHDEFTHPATGQSATTSLMLFNGQASSTGFSANYAFIGQSATTTITPAGYVGIGTTTPFGNLSIHAPSQTNPYFVIGSSTSQVFSISPSLTGSATLTLSTTTAGCLQNNNIGLIFSAICTGGGSVTSIVVGDGLMGTPSTITTSGTIYGQVSTSSTPVLGNLAYWTTLGTTNTAAKLGTVATTSLGVTSPITFSGTLGAQIGGANGNFACATCMTSYDPFTHPSIYQAATTSSMLIGTSTGSNYSLIIASSTAPQISLSAGLGVAQWTFQNSTAATLQIATTTIAGNALSTAFFNIFNTGLIGIGTTTPSTVLNVVGGAILNSEIVLATSTTMTVNLASSTAQVIRWGTGAGTITLSTVSPNAGTSLTGLATRINVCNPGTAGGAITWASSPAGIIRWTGGAVPTQTTTANKCDIWTFTFSNGSSTPILEGSMVPNF